MGARGNSKTKPQHDPDYLRMCEKLLEMRLAAGLTQRDMAKHLGKPKAHSMAFKIEHGERRIDPIEFVRWCRACNVDPGQTLNAFRFK